MGKMVARGLLALYVGTLIGIVLFKFPFHIPANLDHHTRSLNLIPFAAPSIVHGKINFNEMILNCLVFIPFGLLLSVNFKKVGFFTKLAIILVFSLTAECLQYIFAIGAADITDVITNTSGGLLGLTVYHVCSRYLTHEKLDRVILGVGTFLLVLFGAMVALLLGRR